MYLACKSPLALDEIATPLLLIPYEHINKTWDNINFSENGAAVESVTNDSEVDGIGIPSSIKIEVNSAIIFADKSLFNDDVLKKIPGPEWPDAGDLS